MRSSKVKLYIRVRCADGRFVFAQPVWNRNRSLRAGYAQVSGRVEYRPEASYYLRHVRSGKRVCYSVGSDADVALTALRNAEHDLQAQVLVRKPPAEIAPSALPDGGSLAMSLSRAVDIYLAEVRLFRAAKTISACERILGAFQQRYAAKLVGEVTRIDLLGHMAALKQEGLGDRPIFNHVSRVVTLLKANGMADLLRASDWPRYDEKVVSAYTSDQLSRLFAASTAEERQIFAFFLGTGFREQEVTYMSWANVDFTSKVISVWSKPELGFRVKDKEERSVPVPDSLIESLAARRRQSSFALIFPTQHGKPDGHLLR